MDISNSTTSYYLNENLLDYLELDLNEPMHNRFNDVGEIVLDAIIMDAMVIDDEETLASLGIGKRKADTDLHNDSKRAKTDNSILNEWNALSAKFAEESSPHIKTIESYSEAFDNLKSKISTELPRSKTENDSLDKIEFLLKMVHPCPMSTEVMNEELQIIEMSSKYCSAIKQQSKNKPAAKSIICRINEQHKPSLLYNYASDMSKKIHTQIIALEDALEQETVQADKRTHAWIAISNLLEKEIERYTDAYKAYKQLTCKSEFQENIENALGECYERLGDVFFTSKVDFEPLEPIEQAIVYWQRAKVLYAKNSTKVENIAVIDTWILKAQKEIADLKHNYTRRGLTDRFWL